MGWVLDTKMNTAQFLPLRSFQLRERVRSEKGRNLFVPLFTHLINIYRAPTLCQV